MIRLRFETTVRTPADQVWQRVSTMQGVNQELGPWLRMTHPAHLADLKGPGLPSSGYAFSSWLLLCSLLPIDRHHLGFDRILPGEGFDERSSSWTQTLWRHRRRVRAVTEGARITDELDFEPRVPFLAPLLKVIVTAMFRHRHRRLVEIFGGINMAV
jgi:ligand-binding SRPBCC domain-containing protein